MQVFKAYIKVMLKHLPTAIIYLVVFVGIAVAMTFAGLGSEVSVFKEQQLKLCVFDEDNTAASNALAEYLSQKDEIVAIENDDTALTDALYYKTIDYAVTINKGFEEKLISGETDELFTGRGLHGDVNESLALSRLDGYVSAVRAYMAAGYDLENALSKAQTALADGSEVELVAKESEKAAMGLEPYFRYLTYILLCIMLSILCPVIVILCRSDIRSRAQCSGIKTSSYFLQIFLGGAVFVIAVWLILVAVGVALYADSFSGRAAVAVANSFVFALVAASWAIFISCFAPGGSAVNVMTQIISLANSFLCGVFVPMSLLSDGVLKVARFLPGYWYVKLNDMLLGSSRSVKASQAAMYMLIEAAFAVVPLLLAILVRRSAKQKALA